MKFRALDSFMTSQTGQVHARAEFEAEGDLATSLVKRGLAEEVGGKKSKAKGRKAEDGEEGEVTLRTADGAPGEDDPAGQEPETPRTIADETPKGGAAADDVATPRRKMREAPANKAETGAPENK
jgi:hypothetical protein